MDVGEIKEAIMNDMLNYIVFSVGSVMLLGSIVYRCYKVRTENKNDHEKIINIL